MSDKMLDHVTNLIQKETRFDVEVSENVHRTASREAARKVLRYLRRKLREDQPDAD